MKLSTVLLLAAVVAAEDERGSNTCNGSQLMKDGVDGGPMWKCKGGKKKSCQAKCPKGTVMTGPKKVMCDKSDDGKGEPHAFPQNFAGKTAEEGAPGGWTTKLRSYAHWAADEASCVSENIFLTRNTI